MFINNKQFNFDGENPQPRETNPSGGYHTSPAGNNPPMNTVDYMGGYTTPVNNQPNPPGGYGTPVNTPPYGGAYPSYSYPVTHDKKPLKDKRPNTVLLLITFLAFIFVSMLPLYTIEQPLSVDIYATDMAKIAKLGLKLPTYAEGDIIHMAKEESLEDGDDTYSALKNLITSGIIDSASSVEPYIVYALNMVKKSSLGLLAVSVLGLIGFATSIFAAVKNMKKLYFLASLALFAMFLILSGVAIFMFEFGIGIVGYGMWLALVTFALGCIMSLKK